MKNFYIMWAAWFLINWANGQSPISVRPDDSYVLTHQPKYGQLDQARQPADLMQIYDSIYDYNYDTLSAGWQVVRKTIDLVYDDKNNRLSDLEQTWNVSTWENAENNLYTYDERNNRTSWTGQVWLEGNWMDSYRYIYTYDANNNLTSELTQYGGIPWYNSSKYTYTYDENNNLLSELYQMWDGTVWLNYWQWFYEYDEYNNFTYLLGQDWLEGAWVNNQQDFITYNANNSWTNILIQLWVDNAWENSMNSDYTYDENNNLIYYIRKAWNVNAWENAYQRNHNYDGSGHLMYSLEEKWNGLLWLNNEQRTYDYDANHNLKYLLIQSWHENAWVNNVQYRYTLDNNNFLISDAYKQWNLAGTNVIYSDSNYYYYHVALDINDLFCQNKSLSIYPNPASDCITFKLPANPGITNNRVTIYNLHGQPLITLQVSEQPTIVDVTGFPQGVYLVLVRNDKTVLAGKFAKR